jgi:hypothetical protein
LGGVPPQKQKGRQLPTNTKTGFGRVADSVRSWCSTHLLVLIIALLTVSVLYELYVYGQKMQAIAENQLRQTIADEDRVFCAKFGMSAGTPQFVLCGQELEIIRQKQADRDRAAAQGLL